jgi:hypothetical protein
LNVISSAMLVGKAPNCCNLPPTETEALMTFDLSAIPKNAKIVTVLMDFRQFMFYGDPFEQFQCLEVYNVNYGDIRFAKFREQPERFLQRLCTQRDLSNALYFESFRQLVQENAGNTELQILMKFKIPQDASPDLNGQMIFNPNIMLVVIYRTAE